MAAKKKAKKGKTDKIREKAKSTALGKLIGKRRGRMEQMEQGYAEGGLVTKKKCGSKLKEFISKESTGPVSVGRLPKAKKGPRRRRADRT